MSYDLAVFDPSIAPRDRAEFLAWFEKQTEWKEAHDYDDPKVATPVIRRCFLELVEVFPPMNGPYAKEELPEDEDTLTDYSVAHALLYVAFAWSKSEEAYETMMHVAETHGVGFFNVSSESSDVWMPDSTGNLVLMHSDGNL
jgi:hypothetical protein